MTNAPPRTQGPSPAPARQRLLQDPPVPNPIPARIGITEVAEIHTQTIVGPATGFVDTYDGVINPYSGCSFGCSYCYASNFTRNEQERTNWGQWVKVKTNAAARMAQISKGALNDRVYYISTATDPYQPVERLANVTRTILNTIARNHPRARIVLQTRSPLAARDTDLFLKIAQQGGKVQVNMTVTTDDDTIRKTYEPGCPSIQARIKAITALHNAGIQSCITLTPLLPVRDMPSFIDMLKHTGITRFIVQNFHLPDNRSDRFIARTDARAIQSTQTHYNRPAREAVQQYHEEYRANLALLLAAIPNIGQGKKGFAPPF